MAGAHRDESASLESRLADITSQRIPDMRINIDALTEAELIDLNSRIVERLRFLSQARAHSRMLEFRIGDRVSFQPEGRAVVAGMVIRYNRKTVTVIADSGQRWNVAPSLLRREDGSISEPSPGTKVVPLHRSQAPRTTT